MQIGVLQLQGSCVLGWQRGYGARDGAARRDEQRRIYAGELLFLQREIQLQMERYDSTSLSLFLSLVCIQMCLHAGLFSLPLPCACISLSVLHMLAHGEETG